MSLTTAALRQLVEFGLTAEQILSVAEAQGDGAKVAAICAVGKFSSRSTPAAFIVAL